MFSSESVENVVKRNRTLITTQYLHSSRRNTRPERTTPGGKSRGVKSTVAIAHENGVEKRERPCSVEAATL